MALGFHEDILPIFERFAECMRGVKIATDEGIFAVLLDDYERVKLLHREIQGAIHGHDPATPSAHPMPPGGPLGDEEIAKFDQWIGEGMPEIRTVA